MGRRQASSAICALLFLFAAALAFGADPLAAVPSAPPSPAVGLDAARKAMALALGKPDPASALSSLVDSLRPSDALAILQEFAAQLPDAKASKAFLVRGGQLGLLLGDEAGAADFFEAAAFKLPTARDDALLIKSARSRLASGEAAKAQDRAYIVLRSASAPAILLQARLVAAWAFLFMGESAETLALCASLIGQGGGGAPGIQPFLAGPPCPAGSDERKEARFILWAASSVLSRPAAAAALIAEFPGSPEAAIADGSLPDASRRAEAWAQLAPLPHWYLSGVLSVREEGSAGSGRSTVPAPLAKAVASASPGLAASPVATPAASGSPALTRRYQVGIFSDLRHADELVAELQKKGFSPKIEKRTVAGKALLAVIVEGEADATLLRLKDAGYESWPLF